MIVPIGRRAARENRSGRGFHEDFERRATPQCGRAAAFRTPCYGEAAVPGH